MTSDSMLDYLYSQETEKLFNKAYVDSQTEEDNWDEGAEDRALDKWRGFD